MEAARFGNAWPLMLAINVGTILALTVSSKFGLKTVGLFFALVILLFNHYASRHLLPTQKSRHFFGLGLLGMINLVAVSSGDKLPLIFVPFSSGLGVMFVLMLLNVFPTPSTRVHAKMEPK